jgi:hypothetical protein
MTVTELAMKIDTHLHRLEDDAGWNFVPNCDRKRFWHAGAHRAGRFVMVAYISYQATSSLTKNEAEAYLAWLDAGNKGRHYEQQKEAQAQA